MALLSQSHETRERVYHFNSPNSSTTQNSLFGSGLAQGAPTANVSATITTLGIAQIQTIATINKNVGWLDTNDIGGFDIDDLLFAEFVAKITELDAAAFVYLGMISAVNADPDAIAESAFFKVRGSDSKILVETDDAVTDRPNVDTGITIVLNEWYRYRIDFATGIQSISVPGKSKGGKGSIQFSLNDVRGWRTKPQLDQHMDMSGYASWLQPFVMVKDPTGTPAANTTLQLKEICVGARLY